MARAVARVRSAHGGLRGSGAARECGSGRRAASPALQPCRSTPRALSRRVGLTRCELPAVLVEGAVAWRRRRSGGSRRARRCGPCRRAPRPGGWSRSRRCRRAGARSRGCWRSSAVSQAVSSLRPMRRVSSLQASRSTAGIGSPSTTKARSRRTPGPKPTLVSERSRVPGTAFSAMRHSIRGWTLSRACRRVVMAWKMVSEMAQSEMTTGNPEPHGLGVELPADRVLVHGAGCWHGPGARASGPRDAGFRWRNFRRIWRE